MCPHSGAFRTLYPHHAAWNRRRLPTEVPTPDSESAVSADDEVAALRVALVKAVIPLEVILASEALQGPMREIGPSLRALIHEAVDCVRGVIADTPNEVCR